MVKLFCERKEGQEYKYIELDFWSLTKCVFLGHLGIWMIIISVYILILLGVLIIGWF